MNSAELRSTPTFDPTVAVIVDSNRSEYLTAKSTILPALSFWGIPHSTVDLASSVDLSDAIGNSGAILIAQEDLGEVLGERMDVLLAHVRSGTGFINADHTIAAYPDRYRETLGITDSTTEVSVDGIVIPDFDHTVLRNVLAGPGPRLRMPVPGTAAPSGIAGEILLKSDAGEPLLAVHREGAGRIVQWMVSPKIWNRGYLGLAHGIDSLLWRGILWAAPKPFAVNSLRPYVRFRFDDCNGHWRDSQDLSFVDELNEYGYRPSICFCLTALSSDGSEYLASLQRAGRVDLAPHTYSPGTSLFYGDADGEYPTERFAEMFAELDKAKEEWGVCWSTILSDHEHEWSERAVPFLRERGIRHKMNILLPGERWADPHRDWHPGPYGSMSYALDYLPGELSDFFVVFNHHPSFDTARVYPTDDADSFNYHRAGGFGRQKWDFLNGLVTGPDVASKDLDGAVDRLVEHTQIGLDAQFFGGSITHSHFTRFLAPGEMADILDRAAKRLSGIEQIPAGYDEVADYAEAHANTTVRSSRRVGDKIVVEMVGRSWRELQMSVYTEKADELVRHEIPIPAFDGDITVMAYAHES